MVGRISPKNHHSDQQTDAEWEFPILLDIGMDDDETYLAIPGMILKIQHQVVTFLGQMDPLPTLKFPLALISTTFAHVWICGDCWDCWDSAFPHPLARLGYGVAQKDILYAAKQFDL
jgi:hypothetical protein